MINEKLRISPPLYLASTTIKCWSCGADMPAVGLIAPSVPETDDEVSMLYNITELPLSVLDFIQKQFPTFKRAFSKTTKSEYFANTCPRCGLLSGDFFLYSEPGGPFFPVTEEDAACLTVEEIPLDGPIAVSADLSVGGGDMILEFGERRT